MGEGKHEKNGRLFGGQWLVVGRQFCRRYVFEFAYLLMMSFYSIYTFVIAANFFINPAGSLAALRPRL
jgi:hypothetical protein